MENIYAFPVPASKIENMRGDDYNGTQGQEGMTLRDYFAAKAMQGHMASEYGVMVQCPLRDVEALAKVFYGIADAMIKAREEVSNA